MGYLNKMNFVHPSAEPKTKKKPKKGRAADLVIDSLGEGTVLGRDVSRCPAASGSRR
jgi:hypothetical protein